MKDYIRINKRKTITGCLGAGLILIATTIWIYNSPHTKTADGPYILTRSYNVLKSNGRSILFFSNIENDSVFNNASFSASAINQGERLCIDENKLRHIIENYKIKLKEEIKSLDTNEREARYFLNTHNVQEEGFGMIAKYHERIGKERKATTDILKTLNRIGKDDKLTILYKTQWKRLSEIPFSGIFIESLGGQWNNGRWINTKRNGKGIGTDSEGRIICGTWNADTLQDGRRTDSTGTYIGQFNKYRQASGHGLFMTTDNKYYEGRWEDDVRDGFGFEISNTGLRAGEWKSNKYKGERINYTSERIYGIDISRYQHGKGRKYYPIHWKKLRITNLGRLSKKNISGTVDYPVTFIYIKSTEGTTIRNQYYKADYIQARKHGFYCGAYHFFSTKTSGDAQAQYFIKNTCFRKGDFPPVLDVEPTHNQIMKMGGTKTMFNSIRKWMKTVERHTGVKPILYISQSFVNKYLNEAPDIKKNYNIWIARYGEYKPDIKLIYWQLSPDGKVNGIHGDVDINVFNGYQDIFDAFTETQRIR